MSYNADNTLMLEESLLKVPYESMRKTFKNAQKHLERDTNFVATTSASWSNSQEPVKQIDEMINRMQGLKRKISTLKTQQEDHIQKTRARVNFLGKLYDIKDVESPQFREWSKTRLDLLLSDYFLRNGFSETAECHTKSTGIQNLVDDDILHLCLNIEQSLLNKSTAECLGWCQECKVHLKRIHSNLEFEVRLQHFIELARVRKPTEAIAYYRKHLVKNVDAQLLTIQQVSALLAFPPDTEVGTYKELYSDSRWKYLAEMFVSSYREIHGLSNNSALLESLTTGISALKTYSCLHDTDGQRPKTDLSKAHMCPICSVELNQLAEKLPYALHVRSHLESDPVVLPNSRIYGLSKLIDYAEKAGVAKGKIVDPTTAEIFDESELQIVYPS